LRHSSSVIYNLLEARPKEHPLAAFGAALDDKQPRLGRCGVCHRALGQDELLDFGLAAGAGFRY
ncbi:MAG: hypothetical protein II670_07355, partial [Alphaproteobacteria bacterium]|nr:hypothetical protein [Alphaproteobacteria bacterium]